MTADAQAVCTGGICSPKKLNIIILFFVLHLLTLYAIICFHVLLFNVVLSAKLHLGAV
jgi:hypothetical protein